MRKIFFILTITFMISEYANADNCTPGKYWSATDQECITCPENHFCPGGTTNVYLNRYVQVEYIETDGQKGIDTGISGQDGLSFEYQYQVVKPCTSSSKYCNLFSNYSAGLFGAENQNVIRHLFFGNNIIYYNNNWMAANNPSSVNSQIDLNTVYTCKLENNIFTFNGQQFINKSVRTGDINTANIHLFSNAYIQTGSSMSFKLFYFRIKKDDSLIRDFIPVYDSVNRTYGLYDTVSASFFLNYGTGVFSGGPQPTLISCDTTNDGTARFSPPGAPSANDCGPRIHFGEYILYMHRTRKTSPSFCTEIGNNIFYGDMSTEKRGHLRTEYKGQTYSIYNELID